MARARRRGSKRARQRTPAGDRAKIGCGMVQVDDDPARRDRRRRPRWDARWTSPPARPRPRRAPAARAPRPRRRRGPRRSSRRFARGPRGARPRRRAQRRRVLARGQLRPRSGGTSWSHLDRNAGAGGPPPRRGARAARAEPQVDEPQGYDEYTQSALMLLMMHKGIRAGGTSSFARGAARERDPRPRTPRSTCARRPSTPCTSSTAPCRISLHRAPVPWSSRTCCSRFWTSSGSLRATRARCPGSPPRPVALVADAARPPDLPLPDRQATLHDHPHYFYQRWIWVTHGWMVSAAACASRRREPSR